jgi:hypothetical protein
MIQTHGPLGFTPEPRKSDPLTDHSRRRTKPPSHRAPPDLKLNLPAVPVPPAAEVNRADSRSPGRCSERGCVFPAEENALGFCFYHERQQLEPALFCSWQPTWIIVNRAATGLDVCDPGDDRSHDRRRLAAQRDAFFHGLA